MKMLNNIRIGVRLGIGFGVAVLLLCALGGFAPAQASRLREGTKQLPRAWLPKVQTLGNVRAVSSLVRKATLEGVLASDATDRNLQHRRHDAALIKLDAALKTWESVVTFDDEQRLLAQFKAAWSAYLVLDERAGAIAAPSGDHVGDYRGQLTADSAVTFNPVVIALEKAIHWERDAATAAGQRADQDFSRVVFATVLVILMSLALCTAIAITRSITRSSMFDGPVACLNVVRKMKKQEVRQHAHSLCRNAYSAMNFSTPRMRTFKFGSGKRTDWSTWPPIPVWPPRSKMNAMGRLGSRHRSSGWKCSDLA